MIYKCRCYFLTKYNKDKIFFSLFVWWKNREGKNDPICTLPYHFTTFPNRKIQYLICILPYHFKTFPNRKYPQSLFFSFFLFFQFLKNFCYTVIFSVCLFVVFLQSTLLLITKYTIYLTKLWYFSKDYIYIEIANTT